MADPQPGPYYASLNKGQSWQEMGAHSGDPLSVMEVPEYEQLVVMEASF